MKHLFAAAAMAPLCFAASGALAQTVISTAVTTPVLTSAANADLDVAAGGSVIPTVAGAAVTVNTNNKITVEGTILIRDQAASTAVLISTDPAGRTSGFTQTSGIIRSDDTATPVDTDKDGDLDGPFVVDPAVRFGLRVAGAGTFTGDITQTGGLLIAKGNAGSSAIEIDAPMVGSISIKSTIGNLGTNSYAFRSTAPITGTVDIGGTVSSIGQNATAVSVEAPITGALRLDGALTNTGFRYPNRSTDTTVVSKLDADDLLIGGPAVRVSSSVTGGLWLYQAQPATTDQNGAVVATADIDGDGIPDVNEASTSSITQSGSAPALLVGGASAITLGNVGTQANTSYGILIDGSLSAFGVYDGISAQAVKIGGLGGSVNTTGGVRVAGVVTGSATFANVTGVQIGAGANVPKLEIDGTISAGALGDETRIPTLRGIQIDAGANVPSLVIVGTVKTGLNGPEGHLASVLDSSGTLTSIVNKGTVTASINTASVDRAPVGDIIAYDLRANTAGVTISQQLAATDAGLPSTTGDILFGNGNADLEIYNGSVQGTIAYGTGTNTLGIATGAIVSGGLTNAGSSLSATVNGTLAITNSATVRMTSLTTGAGSVVGFTADPKNGTANATSLQVSGAATLGLGTKVSLGFKSKLPTPSGNPFAPVNLVLINAAGGLTNNGYIASLDGLVPYIYNATPTLSANSLAFAVRRRSAAEMGLVGARGAAFEAFYNVFDKDASVNNVVLSKINQADFNTIYNQFLPDYSGGPFNSMVAGVREVMRAQAERPVDMTDSEPRSWLQEVGFGVNHTSPTSQIEYKTAGFAVAAGYEQPSGSLGTLGYSASIMSSDVSDSNRAFGSKLSSTTLLGSVYWRKNLGGLLLDGGATAGYALFDSNRRVVDQGPTGIQNLIRTADGNWTGLMAGARFGAAYEATLGSFYVRPQAMIDYLYLGESGYTENGGGLAINLTVDSRHSSSAEGELGLALGGRFGRGFHWGPELQVAYRATLSGAPGATTAYFSSLPTSPFSLPALAIDKHRLMVRLALRGSGAYANFALEGAGEFGDLYDNYTGRLVVKFLF